MGGTRDAFTRNGKSAGKRSTGRIRFGEGKNIKTQLKKVACEGVDRIDLTQHTVYLHVFRTP